MPQSVNGRYTENGNWCFIPDCCVIGPETMERQQPFQFSPNSWFWSLWAKKEWFLHRMWRPWWWVSFTLVHHQNIWTFHNLHQSPWRTFGVVDIQGLDVLGLDVLGLDVWVWVWRTFGVSDIRGFGNRIGGSGGPGGCPRSRSPYLSLSTSKSSLFLFPFIFLFPLGTLEYVF